MQQLVCLEPFAGSPCVCRRIFPLRPGIKFSNRSRTLGLRSQALARMLRGKAAQSVFMLRDAPCQSSWRIRVHAASFPSI
jgi:hypothetical protein